MTSGNRPPLRQFNCNVGTGCPGITPAEHDGFDIVGKVRPSDDLPDDERRVWVPRTTLPELDAGEIDDFPRWLATHRATPGDMIRVQTLASYDVDSDDDDFRRYLAGETGPLNPHLEPFLAELREDASAGRVWRTVILVDGQLSPYQRYGADWVFPRAQDAGQVIRLLNVAQHSAAKLLRRTGDFWVVEGQHVARVLYDSNGHHLGEIEVSDDAAVGYIAAAELAWTMALPLNTWLTRHPHDRQRSRVA